MQAAGDRKLVSAAGGGSEFDRCVCVKKVLGDEEGGEPGGGHRARGRPVAGVVPAAVGLLHIEEAVFEYLPISALDAGAALGCFPPGECAILSDGVVASPGVGLLLIRPAAGPLTEAVDQPLSVGDEKVVELRREHRPDVGSYRHRIRALHRELLEIGDGVAQPRVLVRLAGVEQRQHGQRGVPAALLDALASWGRLRLPEAVGTLARIELLDNGVDGLLNVLISERFSGDGFLRACG